MEKIIRLTKEQRELLVRLTQRAQPRPVIGPSIATFKALNQKGFAEGKRGICKELGEWYDTEQIMASITHAGRAWLEYPEEEQRAVALLEQLTEIWPRSLTLVIDQSWKRQLQVVHSRDIPREEAKCSDLEFTRVFAGVSIPFKVDD